MATQKTPLSYWIVSNRKRLGWKLEELAARLREAGYEAADTTVRTWEAGRRPHVATIEGLERLFDSAAPVEDARVSGDLAAAIRELTDELRAAREERTALAAKVDRIEAVLDVLAPRAMQGGEGQPAQRETVGSAQ